MMVVAWVVKPWVQGGPKKTSQEERPPHNTTEIEVIYRSFTMSFPVNHLLEVVVGKHFLEAGRTPFKMPLLQGSVKF